MVFETELSALRAPEFFITELDWNPPEDDLFFSSNKVNRSLSHLVGFDGTNSELLGSSSGALKVTGAGFTALELALCGAGDKGLDDLLTQAEALELALCGAGDKGLDDILTALAALVGSREARNLADYFDGGVHCAPFYIPATGASITATVVDIRTAVESIDTILTDCYNAANHYLRTHETT